MKTQIIQIGNSQGVRIPKVFLEECGITGEVELEMHDAGILIRNAQKPRAGWDAAFKALAENEDDDQIATGATTDFDRKEWQW
jgi:antitoxin MazE